MNGEKMTKKIKYNENTSQELLNNSTKLDDEIVTLTKKSLLNLEKIITKNRELRVKYNDQPSKFIDSECDLYNELQRFIINIPETMYFPMMIELHFVDTLFELLSHENTDICVCVLQILLEMTDIDDLINHEIATEQLFVSFENNNCFNVVMRLLKRFQHEQEIDNCDICFSFIDNLLEYDRESMSKMPEIVGDLLIFLFDFIKYDERDKYITMKLHAADIMAVLLQMDIDNNKVFNSRNGVKLLLDILIMYKTVNPMKGEERELMETLFDTLCSCLLFDFNKQQFYNHDGLLVVVNLLKERKKSCFGAVKILSFLFSSHEDLQSHTHKFIELLGLKYLFPLFLKNLKKSSNMSRNDYDEYFCTIIKSLLKNSSGLHYQRVINKFIESGYAKLDRLLEIFNLYLDTIELYDKNMMEKVNVNKNVAFDDFKNDPTIYNDRLGNGLFTLQLVSVILLELLTLNHTGIHTRIVNFFHQNSINILKMVDIIQDYCEKLTELNNQTCAKSDTLTKDINEQSARDAVNERKRLENLLTNVKNV